MKNKRRKTIVFNLLLWLICHSLLFSSDTPQDQFDDFAELNIEDLLNQEVSIATKTKQRISEAPAIVTVITAQEIYNMGARTIRDILETIPGFEFSKSRNNLYQMGIRGTKDQRSTTKLLILIDGVPFNSIFYGSSLFGGNEFNMDIIEKVEIIRGPGSALYGRNAFSAIINIITKSAKSSNEIKLYAGGGNFGNLPVFINPFGGNFDISHGGISLNIVKNNYNLLVSYTKFKSDGHRPEFINPIGGDKISPDYYNNNHYINYKSKYKNLILSGLYTSYDIGASEGPNITKTSTHIKYSIHSVNYQKNILDDLKFTGKLFAQNRNRIQNITIFNPGIHPIFPNGMHVKPKHSEYKYGFESEIKYTTSENNHLVGGIQFELYGAKDEGIKSSYDLYTGQPLLFTANNGDTIYYGKNNMPEWTEGWIDKGGHDYYNLAVFLQDTYYPFSSAGFTFGVRYDYDSEFYGIINPRGGLVWNLYKNTTLKFLYGQAYKAPVCDQQYKKVGFTIGNKNLDPEKIKTYEISLGNRYNNWAIDLTAFYNKIEDLINPNPDPNSPESVTNTGENIAKGIELEYKYVYNKNFSWYLNYSYVMSEDINFMNIIDSNNIVIGEEKLKTDHIDISPNKLNTGFNWKFLNYLNLNTSLRYRGEKIKAGHLKNTKSKIGDNYILLNSTLGISNLISEFKISFSVYNIMNKKYYDFQGETLNTSGVYVNPAQPGRSFILRANYTFKHK